MDEKKKLVVVMVLAIVIVAVGAFQFVGGSSAPKSAATEKKADAKKTEEPKGPKNPQVADQLPQRDPFEAPELPKPEDIKKVAEATSTVTPKAAAASFKPLPSPRERRDFSRITPLPVPIQSSGSSSPMTLAPKMDTRPNCVLRGVLLGPHPAAVFGVGDLQKVVEQGGFIDGDTRVISIEADAAIVSCHGKTQRITLGGNGLGK